MWENCILNFKNDFQNYYECIQDYLGYDLDVKNIINSICQLILFLENEIHSNPEYRDNSCTIIQMFLRDKTTFTKDFVTELNEICDKFKSTNYDLLNSRSRLISDDDYYIPKKSNRSSGFKSQSLASLDSLFISDSLSRFEKNINDKLSRLSLILDELNTKVDDRFNSIDLNMLESKNSIKEIRSKLSRSMRNIYFDEE